MRLKSGGTMNRTLDQLVDVEKIDRHGFDPVADRKQVTEFDRLTTSLRNASLRYKLAASTAAPEAAATPTETETASTTATSWAYKPLPKHEFGEQYVLNAIAAYQRNSSTTTSTQANATVATTVTPTAPPIVASTTPVAQPAAAATAPAATSTPTPSTTPAATTKPAVTTAQPDLATQLGTLLSTLLGIKR